MHSETLRCGLLGRTLGHSYSPAIHAQLAGYSYLLYEKGAGGAGGLSALRGI